MSKFKNYLIKEIVGTIAYWVSPKGEVVQVNTNHIDVVITNPSKFGLTRDEIQRLYNKYNETLGQEGKAREEIIIDIVKKGWVRIRRYRSSYSVNVARISDKRTNDVIFDWSVKLTTTGILSAKERDVHMPVNIIGFLDGKQTSVTLKDIQSGELYEGDEVFNPDDGITICESMSEVQ